MVICALFLKKCAFLPSRIFNSNVNLMRTHTCECKGEGESGENEVDSPSNLCSCIGFFVGASELREGCR